MVFLMEFYFNYEIRIFNFLQGPPCAGPAPPQTSRGVLGSDRRSFQHRQSVSSSFPRSGDDLPLRVMPSLISPFG